MGRSLEFETTRELVDWLAKAPPGTLIEAGQLREALERAVSSDGSAQPNHAPEPPIAVLTWRERLWSAPAEARIGASELAEALGRGKGWVYRRTAPNGNKSPLPHRKLDGELVFMVGEIRDWLNDHEIVVNPR